MIDSTGSDMPDPPVNVFLQYADGSEVPVDVAYRGWIDGVHQWRVVSQYPPGRIIGMHIDKLPPKTAIDLPFRDIA